MLVHQSSGLQRPFALSGPLAATVATGPVCAGTQTCVCGCGCTFFADVLVYPDRACCTNVQRLDIHINIGLGRRCFRVLGRGQRFYSPRPARNVAIRAQRVEPPTGPNCRSPQGSNKACLCIQSKPNIMANGPNKDIQCWSSAFCEGPARPLLLCELPQTTPAIDTW